MAFLTLVTLPPPLNYNIPIYKILLQVHQKKQS